ncbi:MAG: hypothetical protein ACTSR2_06415 [Candidatus Hodarchaeales archaeon]
MLLELYEYGYAGYSELVQTLKLTTGVFYHHIRLLIEAELIKQSEDKTYKITPMGVQAGEFLRNSLPPQEKWQMDQLFSYYNVFSKRIDSFPVFSIFIQLLLIVCGLFWLSFSFQFSLVGYFIISFDQPIISIIYSFIFTFTNLIMLYIFLLVTGRRSIKKITLAANILFPQTLAVLIVVISGIFPFLTLLEFFSPFIGISFTIFFQSFSLTYYLRILQKNRIRSVEKIIVVFLLLQYWNLLALYLFF